MLMLSNLTANGARNAGKVSLRCARLGPHVHASTRTSVRPSATGATLQSSSATRARDGSEMEVGQAKRAVALAGSARRRTRSRVPRPSVCVRACVHVGTLHTQTFCKRNRLFFSFFAHTNTQERRTWLRARPNWRYSPSPGETALCGPAALTIGAILHPSQCPPRPPPPSALPCDE